MAKKAKPTRKIRATDRAVQTKKDDSKTVSAKPKQEVPVDEQKKDTPDPKKKPGAITVPKHKTRAVVDRELIEANRKLGEKTKHIETIEIAAKAVADQLRDEKKVRIEAEGARDASNNKVTGLNATIRRLDSAAVKADDENISLQNKLTNRNNKITSLIEEKDIQDRRNRTLATDLATSESRITIFERYAKMFADKSWWSRLTYSTKGIKRFLKL